MSNAPERKEGSTPVSTEVDRLQRLTLVPRVERSLKRNLIRIELDDQLVSVCGGKRRRPGAARVTGEEAGTEPSQAASSAKADNRVSRIAAFAIAGLLIGYFLGKHR